MTRRTVGGNNAMISVPNGVSVPIVSIAATTVHSYLHKPIDQKPDHQAGLYAVQPVVLPDNHHPDRAPPEPPGRLITQVSTATPTTQNGPISWFILVDGRQPRRICINPLGGGRTSAADGKKGRPFLRPADRRRLLELLASCPNDCIEAAPRCRSHISWAQT